MSILREDAGNNWARNYTYGATTLLRPRTVEEVQEVVAAATRVRALGSRHSFNDLPDTSGQLVSLDGLPADVQLDESARTVSVSAGQRYGDLATALQERGWALHNLASLPHISVAGAISTGTHGSGDRNGNLAAVVVALEFVTATGELLTVRRGDADFDGSVVSLGALGIMTRVTLEIEPTFEVRQDLYDDLDWTVYLDNFDALTSSAYSVSMFTNYTGDTIGTSWLKSRVDAAAPPAQLFGAAHQTADRHMLPGAPATNVSVQSGVVGPWNDRLAHFKLGFTPSNGDEFQSEYLMPRANAREAIEGLRTLGHLIAPLVFMSEIRTMSADSLWLSGAYGTDTVGLHFTWRPLPAEVGALLPEIEQLLLPLGGRPHWGKVFRAEAADIAPLYPRMANFTALVARLDPQGKFGNAYLKRVLG